MSGDSKFFQTNPEKDAEIKRELESVNNRDKLEAMKRLIAVRFSSWTTFSRE